MTCLYNLSDQTKSKYNVLESETYLVRYHRFLFDKLSKSNEEYLELFSAFECGVEEYVNETSHYEPKEIIPLDRYRNGFWVTLNRAEYSLYLNFLEIVVIPQISSPEENTRVLITTYNGCTLMAHYYNGEYCRRKENGYAKIEDVVVIHWKPFE